MYFAMEKIQSSITYLISTKTIGEVVNYVLAANYDISLISTNEMVMFPVLGQFFLIKR